MDERKQSSLADAIAAKLAEEGLAPADVPRAWIDFVGVARVTVVTDEGVDVTFRNFHNLGGDHKARGELAQIAVEEAERRAGRG